MTDLWLAAPPDIFTAALRHPALAVRLRETIDRHRWDELADQAFSAVLGQPQPLRPLEACQARTAVVTGAEEMPSFRRSAHLIGRALPLSRIVEIPATGHLCLIEDPVAATTLIRAQIGYSPPPPGSASQATPGVT